MWLSITMCLEATCIQPCIHDFCAVSCAHHEYACPAALYVYGATSLLLDSALPLGPARHAADTRHAGTVGSEEREGVLGPQASLALKAFAYTALHLCSVCTPVSSESISVEYCILTSQICRR